jgi:mitochondrial-processing peptidase subunit alpha
LRVVREIEAIGGSVKATASREMMGYTYGALKTYMPEMVEVLIDCVRNPAFLDWEVKEEGPCLSFNTPPPPHLS